MSRILSDKSWRSRVSSQRRILVSTSVRVRFSACSTGVHVGLASLLENKLEIAADIRLFNNLLRTAETIERDLRQGKLHPFEEAFK